MLTGLGIWHQALRPQVSGELHYNRQHVCRGNASIKVELALQHWPHEFLSADDMCAGSPGKILSVGGSKD